MIIYEIPQQTIDAELDRLLKLVTEGAQDEAIAATGAIRALIWISGKHTKGIDLCNLPQR